MNVATASATAYRPVEFMTARSATNGATVAGGKSPPGEDQAQSVYERFPIVAFSYENKASRLVMHFRDPDTGQSVSQIPSEEALKRYAERQKTERRDELREKFEVIVDGADPKAEGATGKPGDAAGGAPTGGVGAKGGGSSVAGTTGGSSYTGASGGTSYTGASGGSSVSVGGGIGFGASGSGGTGSGASSGSVNLVI